MNYQKFRSIHNYSSLFISALIFSLSDKMGWNLKWWFVIPIYFIIQYIGRLLYVYFFGFVISKIQFLDKDGDMQSFIMFYKFGLIKTYFICGEFNNKMNLSEKKLELLIYLQAPKKILKNTKKYGEKTEIIFNYHGDNVPVFFIQRL
jgi:hypothetical protein